MFLVSAPSPSIQSYDTYQSWFVACDNALTCVAKSVAYNGNAYEITLSREAGPTGKLALELAVSLKAALATIKVDGRPANLRVPAWSSTTENDNFAANLSSKAGTPQRLPTLEKTHFLVAAIWAYRQVV